MKSLLSGLLRGSAAGAAGAGAYLATGYVDGSTGRTTRACRRADLLEVTAAGLGVGALAGVLRAAGVRPPAAVSGPLLGLAAAAASGGPPAVLRIVDPRRSARSHGTDWLAEAIPPLVYGFTTHSTLVSVSRVAEGREAVPPASLVALLRAAALGAASGSRSATGLAAVALASTSDDAGPVASRLGGRTGTTLSSLAAAGELVADKLPGVPSRLAPLGLVPRAAAGATSAAAVARRDGHDATLPGLVGAAAAIGTAVLGVRLRAAAKQRFGSDRPGAVAEDVLAALLGWLGARRPTPAAPPQMTARPLAR
jgi:uncharacterized membrane protein